MSRSIRKTPIVKDGGRSSKRGKKQANKAVRKYKDEISNGAAYKKIYCSYNINDYITYWTEEDAIELYYELKEKYSNWGMDYFEKKYPTLESYLLYWRKEMKYK